MRCLRDLAMVTKTVTAVTDARKPRNDVAESRSDGSERRAPELVTMAWEKSILGAYVLGYGPVELFTSQSMIWQARVETAEGHLRFPRDIAEFIPRDDVWHAVQALAKEGRLSAVAAADLGMQWEKCRRVLADMLQALRRKPRGGFADRYGMDFPPGARDLTRFVRWTRTSLNGDHHLQSWRRLGEHLARLTPMWEVRRTAGEVHRALKHIRSAGDYSFLDKVAAALSWQAGSGPMPERVGALVTQPFQEVDSYRIDGYIRYCLTNGGAPEPWIVLDRTCLRLFGMELPFQEFSEPEQAIFWLLSERPGQKLSRREIIEQGNLSCAMADLKVNVSHLRDRLRPAILKSKQALTPAAQLCLIIGHRGHPGPYELSVDPILVEVRGARPDFLPPPPRPGRLRRQN